MPTKGELSTLKDPKCKIRVRQAGLSPSMTTLHMTTMITMTTVPAIITTITMGTTIMTILPDTITTAMTMADTITLTNFVRPVGGAC